MGREAVKVPDKITVTHAVPFGSNLDLILRGAIGAVNRFADQVGGGLQAIALALSTPHDNSGDVQARLDSLASKLKASGEVLEDAINKYPKQEK